MPTTDDVEVKELLDRDEDYLTGPIIARGRVDDEAELSDDGSK